MDNNKFKSNNFKIPDGYFDSFEENLFHKLNNKAHSNNDGFNVPNNYFDSVENNVLNKLDFSITNTPKVIPLKNNFIRKFIPISVAASLLLFFGISLLNNEKPNLNNIASNEIEIWIEDNLDQIDSYVISDVYSDTILENTSDIFNDDDIINYLENSNSNTEFIINEL